MTTTRAALVLAVIAAAAIVAGTAVLWGCGVALIVAGALGLAAAVLLYDPSSANQSRMATNAAAIQAGKRP